MKKLLIKRRSVKKNWKLFSVLFGLGMLFIACHETQKKTDPSSGLRATKESASKPNIVLIMADDIGYSDLGCYGSEINTPNIDRLATNGMRFNTFYNMAKCNPTRSTMLTGLYRGGNGAVHIAQLAKQAGYKTLMSGKDHFDSWVPDYLRAHEVFDHSFYFWATTEYFLPPSGVFQRPFFLEGKQISPQEIMHHQKPMYKTDFITDYALKWLEEPIEKEEPFFLYLPYHAAHYPLQARPEDIAKYRGKYLKGWDVLRKERLQRIVAEGLLQEDTRLSLPEGNLNTMRGPLIDDYNDYYPWKGLSEAKKDSLDLEMAVYAAMIDRMDQNIGRVLHKLEASDKMDNTIVMFLVDNGSCPFYSNKGEKEAGPADSYWCLRANWANLGNTPFRQFKQNGHEGGCRTPFIVHWPGKTPANTITEQPGHIVDIAPTFLDLLNVKYPDSVQGYKTLPLQGNSLLPIFKGEKRQEPEFFISGYSEDFRMFRKKNWKITRMNGGAWELYDLDNDRTEMDDLAEVNSDKLQEMLESYAIRKKDVGLVDKGEGYDYWWPDAVKPDSKGK